MSPTRKTDAGHYQEWKPLVGWTCQPNCPECCQADLFAPKAASLPSHEPEAGMARRSDPETSQVAARTVGAQSLEVTIVRSLRILGPATTEELVVRLNIEKVTISPRMKPLCDKGLVRAKETKIGTHNKPVTVWEAVQVENQQAASV